MVPTNVDIIGCIDLLSFDGRCLLTEMCVQKIFVPNLFISETKTMMIRKLNTCQPVMLIHKLKPC